MMASEADTTTMTTAEATAEMTAEMTAEVTAEMTAEMTAEVTAEMTAEVTSEVTVMPSGRYESIPMTSDEVVTFFRERFAMLQSLEPGWKDSDDDEEQETSNRVPPSSAICERLCNIMVKNADCFTTNLDLPHICPLEEYGGLDFFWLGGLSMRFHDAIVFSATSTLPASYYFTDTKPRPIITQKGDLSDLEDSDIEATLRQHFLK